MSEVYKNIFSGGKIRILDTLTSNQIAAGEVIERPASVVKELVENAIDSGATRIKVKVLDDKGEHIQVSDNGKGMIPEDLVRCVLRHATSKIHRVEDLSVLSSLGFRGEALPSIASVSKMTISSCPHGALSGYQIKVQDGTAQIPQEFGMAEGTIVTVEKLFYNTPARKKFLKSPQWELGQIGELMSKMALSRPGIAFSLEINGKTLLNTSGGGDLSQLILSVFGRETLSKMVNVDWLENILIYGMVSLPELNRANRSQYNFFINNRWVRCKELADAVDEAYHTLLPKGRYPLVILYLSIAPSQMDVNVHPAKLEIKLRDAAAVQKSLSTAISKALAEKERLTPKLVSSIPNKPPLGGGDGTFRLEEKDRKKLYLKNRHNLNEWQPNNIMHALYGQPRNKNSIKLSPENTKENNANSFQAGYSIQKALPLLGNELNNGLSASNGLNPLNGEPKLNPQQNRDETNCQSFLYAALRPLGQVGATYIVAEGENEIYIIDQHAAHERILYEKFKAKASENTGQAQALAIPITLELGHEEASLLTEYIIPINELGFIVEHFGDNTFILRAAPSWYEGSDPQGLLFELLAQGKKTPGDKLFLPRHEELFLHACKSAVKANQYLNEGDINHLFSGLDNCQNPSTCPHGRPVAIKLSLDEIRRKFLRSSI